MDWHMMRYTKAMLDRWGSYVERNLLEQHGLPRIEVAYAASMGRGGGQNGHRILCMDPPRVVWVCGYLVSQLPAGEREAVEAWHVFRLKPDHTPYDPREKAKILSIRYGTFKVRVHRGTQKVALGLAHFSA